MDGSSGDQRRSFGCVYAESVSLGSPLVSLVRVIANFESVCRSRPGTESRGG